MGGVNLSDRVVIHDWRGEPITLGSRVVYPIKYLDRKALVEGEVVKITFHRAWNGSPGIRFTIRPIRETSDRSPIEVVNGGLRTVWRWEHITVVPDNKSNQ